MNIFYLYAADAVVIVHFAYIAFVVLGLLAIPVGAAMKWRWTRHFRFRFLHLAAMMVVVAETLLGITCPLTTWEHSLRKLAGESSYQGDFIAVWVHNAMFFDVPPWVFTVGYVLFGAVVLLTFFLVPPTWPKTRYRWFQKRRA